MFSHYKFPGGGDKNYSPNISLAAAHTIRDEFPGVEKIANFYSYNVSVTVPNQPGHALQHPAKYEQGDSYDMIIAEPAYFSIFQYQWLAGSPATCAISNPENGLRLAMPARMGDENYVPLYGLKLIAGRNLRMQKADTITEYLLSKLAAKELGFRRPEDAIGHTLSTMRWGGPVVGILADFYSQSLLDPIRPLFVMASIPALGPWSLSVKMTAADNDDHSYQNTLTAIQKAFKETYPTELFNYSVFKDDIAQFYEEERRTSTIINAAMFISLLISCMGLFGLAAFTAGKRNKEIGIRKVLGANARGIVLLLVRQFLKLVFLAFLIASPIAWYFMHKWLLDYANRISMGRRVFAVAGSAAMIVALPTVGFHAMKAATANPVKVLRSE
ncbi:MAG TPA: FtsX-like permease family protein [Puia sp.]